ncbi:MAG: molecular chaperone HtpG [Synergistaceae bacterium]|jgi:molecular chaperone HtpG|nr:molecular chaperone HtpG [Synergistaceae bacterium]
MTNSAEKMEFQSEAKQVLDLMIHSVYSNPDIFLRELISNASDALDKLRIENLSSDHESESIAPAQITVLTDKRRRTITVSDNGIGMSRDELVSFLGTIARSGTKEFIHAMREMSSGNGELIGQFGVGFYSSFIVAGRVTVETRRFGSDESWLWDSTGDGTYTIEPGLRAECGTDVTLYLRDRAESDEDSGADSKDYLSSWTLREIIKKYSDFVSHPIYLKDSDDKKDGEGGAPPEPVNSMKALWIRPEASVSDDEYKEFYRHITHDWEDPMERIVYKAEGTNEFHALLYIPSRPPFDLYYRDGAHGIQLYIRRVFIMSDCRDLIPEYLRFVRGVVDSEDLPLNVSREILQQDRQTAMIKRSLTRKVLDTLKKMKQERPEEYAKFWDKFGEVLKEGIISDAKNRESIMSLGLFSSSKSGRTSLESYVAAMNDGQKSIYYLSGAKSAVLADSPKLEAFSERGLDVLLLGDPVDEIWVAAASEFEGHPFVSASAADIEIEGGGQASSNRAEAKKLEESGFLSRVKEAVSGMDLGVKIEDVRLSSRLVDSPATFVQKGDAISPQMRNFFKSMGQDAPPEQRVLEINPAHPLIQKIASRVEEHVDEPGNIGEWAALITGLASIADGEVVANGRDFTHTIEKLLL